MLIIRSKDKQTIILAESQMSFQICTRTYDTDEYAVKMEAVNCGPKNVYETDTLDNAVRFMDKLWQDLAYQGYATLDFASQVYQENVVEYSYNDIQIAEDTDEAQAE